MKKSSCLVESVIKNEKPHIIIEMTYQDDFTDDQYIIESCTEDGTKKIPFKINRNNMTIGFADLDERDYEKFLEKVFNISEDHDFKKTITSEHKSQIIADLKKFMDYFDNAIILNGLTLEGQLRRMKSLAGLL